MRESEKMAVPLAEKFRFDRSFDSADVLPKLLNEEQVESVRLESFEKGRQQALGEVDSLLENSVSKLLSETSVLQSQYEILKKRFEEEAVSLTFAIFEKIFPSFMEEHGQKAFQDSFQKALKSCDIDRDIVIRVAPSLEEPLKDRLKKKNPKESAEQNKNIQIQGDDSLRETQAFFDWNGGGLFYDQLAFVQALEKALIAGGVIKKSKKTQEKHIENSEKALENEEDKKGEDDDV